MHALIPGRVFYTWALFFNKAAFLNFSGAYAVLAYIAHIAQASVEKYGWLSGAQMVAGLGLGETTPGPHVMVVHFVGFMAGWKKGGLICRLF